MRIERNTLRAVLLACLILLIPVGCGGKSESDASDKAGTEPLTLERWRELPIEQKYEVPNLERLRAGEPKFADERAWENFLRRELIPSRRRELGR